VDATRGVKNPVTGAQPAGIGPNVPTATIEAS
jgi:hypothetical protein